MSQVKHVIEYAHDDQIYADCSPMSERSLSNSLCQECIIENYSTLEEKTCYSMTDTKFLQRILKLYKRKTTHTFQFHCELTNFGIQREYGLHSTNKMKCYIAYDKYEAICPGNLDETMYGFSIDVPKDIIMDPNNKYLHEDDKLVIQFRYRKYFCNRDNSFRIGTTAKEDEESLSRDLLSLYKSQKFTDFKIFDQDMKAHNVHKAICRTRSRAICDLNDATGIGVKGTSQYLEIVIRYMYSGILPQLSVDDLLKVTVVAEDLDIPCLRQSIQRALLENLNKDTAKKIKEVCLDYKKMYLLAETAIDIELLTS